MSIDQRKSKERAHSRDNGVHKMLGETHQRKSPPCWAHGSWTLWTETGKEVNMGQRAGETGWCQSLIQVADIKSWSGFAWGSTWKHILSEGKKGKTKSMQIRTSPNGKQRRAC